ncbi:hypothetical protein [Nocardioides sp. SYSU DS0651]|uniref:hypothetical protein n=1 Tax=Nocardioides sp. SYSU DS0651 TaxID=3415955 RepID=UPI003F4B31EB
MSETPVAAADAGPAGTSGRGVLGFAGVLLVVLVLLLLGSRQELLLGFGVTGEAGSFTATDCGRDLQYDGTTARAQCVGVLTPADGGRPYAAELYHDGEPGESYAVRADPGSGTAYRTSLWARWASLSLPLVAVALLWLTLGWWWAQRRPGVLGRAQRLVLVAVFAAPAALLLVAAAAGFVVSVATS